MLTATLCRRPQDMYDAVVRVFCVHTEPNFSLPWQRKRQQSSTSSGFVISGNRILTNAHSVEYSTQVGGADQADWRVLRRLVPQRRASADASQAFTV